MRNVQILSTGSYVPERVVTNAEVDARGGERFIGVVLQNDVGVRAVAQIAKGALIRLLDIDAGKGAAPDVG